MARQRKITHKTNLRQHISSEEVENDSSQSRTEMEMAEQMQTVEGDSLDESEDEMIEQSPPPDMPEAEVESDEDVSQTDETASASTLYPPDYTPPPREKSLARKLKVAEEILNRLHFFERLAGARPRLVTRRKRIDRSIRIQEEVVAELRDEIMGQKKAESRRRTSLTRYVQSPPSEELKRKGAMSQLGQTISKRKKR